MIRRVTTTPATAPPAPDDTGDVTSPRARMFLWVFSVIMVLAAGIAFLFKLIEFFYTATKSGSDALGSFLIPVLTYLTVAAGFACMFVWAYLTGQFRNVERTKMRMLEMQYEIDRSEANLRRGRRS